MYTFFDSRSPEAFVPFSMSHLVCLAVLIVAAIMLYGFRRSIRKNPALKRTVRFLLLGALIMPEAGLYVWTFSENLWDPKYSLPLELCSITMLLSIAMLLTGSRLLYPLVFFAGIGGALQAILTPELGYAFPHFRFFHFFIVHTVIILSALYMTWVENYRPSWKSIFFTMLFLNFLVVTVGTADYLLGANYMFLMHKPDSASVLDLLGPYPFYLVSEEVLALVIFCLMYVPFLPEIRKNVFKARPLR